MGYHDDDRYGGGNRWRDRDDGRSNERSQSDRDRDYGRGGDYGRSGDRWNEGGRERAGWGSGLGSDDGRRDQGRGRDQDRGFFERAGEEVRSWFGGGGDDRRDYGRDYDRDREHSGGSYGWMSNGWGNQAGESWNRDRPGVRNEREGWFTDSVGGERGRRLGGSGGRDSDYRGDPGAGPMGAAFGAGYGSAGQLGPSRSTGMNRGADLHDPHYSQWRQRQIEDLDRDYDEYRREHQSKFEQEFGGWRQKRQGQRQMLGKATEDMEVVGSDGSHVGTVDKVRGDRIILTKGDASAGGLHHSIPCGWVENIEDKVILNRTAEQAMTEWREEERNRALFERDDSGSDGPHVLNRSFSGTYSDRDDR